MELPFVCSGNVIKGNQLGRTIGFPTANILPEDIAEFPLKNGVYAVDVLVMSQLFQGMANVGVKPTFGQNQMTIEVHIFDFTEDIYGESMIVTFQNYIREERKFPGVDALKEQIAKDEIMIRNILSDRV